MVAGSLAALSVLHSATSVITIPGEALWPIRMVAREISPWFLLLNLLGIALTVRRSRLRLVIFVAGLGVALWPIAQRWQVAADISAQWRQQDFGADLRVAGPLETMVESVRGVAVAAIQPEVISPAMHLYRSPDSPRTERLPIIVDIHGGSWQVGGVREDSVFSQRMAAKGYAVFAIDYRKAPAFKFPSQLGDVRDAITWIRDNAVRLGGDPDRMALVGRSAGGHLAMLAAYTGDAGPIRSVVNFYGPGDLTALYEHPPSPDPLHVQNKLEALLGAAPSERPELYRSASPVSRLRGDLPPTLHIQGGSDNVVQLKLTRELHRRILAAGSRSLLLEIPRADHSFDFVYFGPSSTIAQSVVDAFLTATLNTRPRQVVDRLEYLRGSRK